MKEKNAATNQASLIIGDIVYTKSEKTAVYNLKFPKKEKWVFQDTMLLKYRNDSLIEEKIMRFFSQENIFNNLLDNQSTDYGLSDINFTIAEVDESGDDAVSVTWVPPVQLEDKVKSVITTVEDNVLMAVKIYNPEGNLALESYNEDHQVISNISVPMKISSRSSSQYGDIFKVITFRNVNIQ